MHKEIARADWPRFFESFTQQHDHWLVSVDGEREMLPLEGITLRDDGNLVIHLGGDIRHHRVITIDAKRVVVAEQAGAEEGVDLESTDGHTTRLRFRTPMPPELAEGVLP